MARRALAGVLLALLLGSCAAQPAVRRRAEDPQSLVGAMPWVPQTREAVEQCARAHSAE